MLDMRRVHAESVHHLGIHSTPYGQEFVQERDSGGGEGTNRITCYTKGPYVNKYNGMHALYKTKEASFPHRALREAHKIITTRHKAQGTVGCWGSADDLRRNLEAGCRRGAGGQQEWPCS